MKIKFFLQYIALPGAFMGWLSFGFAQDITLQPGGTGSTSVLSPTPGDTALSITDSRTIRFKPGNGGVVVGAFGAERLFVSNGGNVGIGTTTPQTLLQLGNYTHLFPLVIGPDQYSTFAQNMYWDGSLFTKSVAGPSSALILGESSGSSFFNLMQFPTGAANSTFSPNSWDYKLAFKNGKLAINQDNASAGLHIESPDNQALYLDMSTDGSRPEMRIFGDITHSAGIKASSTMPASYTLTLPDDDGTSGQLLHTDGNGFLTWVDPAGTPTLIQDAGANTSVNVEKTANDNLIRFTISGTEKIVFQNNPVGDVVINYAQSNIFIGNSSGLNNTAANNVFVGNLSGALNTAGDQNVYLGFEAGKQGTTAARNAFVGFGAGKNTTTGVQNTFLGSEAGRDNAAANNNTYLGAEAGRTSTGKENTYVGASAGTNSVTGEGNTLVGYGAGYQLNGGFNNVMIGKVAGSTNVTGSGNIFIGNSAGANETGSNMLYIDNFNTATPLIKGDFASDKLTVNGDLSVTGSVTASNVYFPAPVTHYLSVPGAAFSSISALGQVVRDNTGPFQPYIHLTGSTQAVAPVYLPDGANIKMVKMVFDTDLPIGSVIAADMMMLNNTGAFTLATADYTGVATATPTTVFKNVSGGHIVDNQNNSYMIMFTTPVLGVNNKLYRVIVEGVVAAL